MDAALLQEKQEPAGDPADDGREKLADGAAPDADAPVLAAVVKRLAAMEASLLQLHEKFDSVMEAQERAQPAPTQYFDIGDQGTKWRQIMVEMKQCMARANAVVEHSVWARAHDRSPRDGAPDAIARIHELNFDEIDARDLRPGSAKPPLLNPSDLLGMDDGPGQPDVSTPEKWPRRYIAKYIEKGRAEAPAPKALLEAPKAPSEAPAPKTPRGKDPDATKPHAAKDPDATKPHAAKDLSGVRDPDAMKPKWVPKLRMGDASSPPP